MAISRIKPQNRSDDRVKTLCLAGIIAIWSAAITKAKVASARIQQPVIGVTWLGRWVESDVTEGV